MWASWPCRQYSAICSLVLQEYRARKRQKLQKKLADQLRTSLQQSQSATAGLGVGTDLQSVLDSFAGTRDHWVNWLAIIINVCTFCDVLLLLDSFFSR